MNPRDIINQSIEESAEYLEMCENPDEFLVWVLANKLSVMQGKMEYLEKVAAHVYK